MSGLEESLADYLQVRRSLGHQLADPGRLLPHFVAFLDSRGLSTVTVAAAVEWATTPATDPRSTVGPRRMTAVRGFARYLVGIDPATEVPPRGLLPQPTRWRGPFVFSPADIEVIMNRAASFTPRLRSATYVTLIGLLAATGLRIGEAIKLDRADIDWSTGVLLVRESKFGKSRLVPVTATTLQALANYADLRDQIQQRRRPPSFFVSRTRQRLCYAVVSQTFRRLIDDSGGGGGAARGGRRPARRPPRAAAPPGSACLPPPTPPGSADSAPPAAPAPPHHGGLGRTTSATLSPSGPCWAGIGPVRMCKPRSRRCRPTLVTANPAPPTGICPRSPSCSRALRPGGKRRRR